LILGSWWIVVALGVFPTYVLPSPVSVFAVILEKPEAFAGPLLETLGTMALGGSTGVVAGVSIGMLVHYLPGLGRVIYPALVATQNVPIPVIAPILVLMLGYGLAPKIVVIALWIFFPIVINTAEGLRSTPPALISFIRSLGGSRRQVAWHAEIPSALPSMFAAFRIAASYTVIAAVISEWVSGETGLGSLMLRASLGFANPAVFASLVLMIGAGIGVYLFVLALQRILIPWHGDSGRGR
jgi:ABC-type nitrate/sulfonate/bicarbonate transport system permease component